MNRTIKKYHIGDILSVTTGKLVSPRHIDGVYDVLNYMTGDNLFTHQLPRVSRECAPHLLAQHPQLRAVTGDDVTGENWQQWLDDMVDRFGKTLPVVPLPEGTHEHINPLIELAAMRGGKPDATN